MRTIICSALVLVSFASIGTAAYLNETDVAGEADFCNLQFPSSITMNSGDSTGFIYGRIYEAGVTEPSGPSGMITAEVGYGPNGSDPTVSNAWQWFSASYNVQAGNDDEYQGSFTVNTPGTYAYTYRFSLDGGTDWTAADLNGAGSNQGLTFEPTQLGTLTVLPVPEPVIPGLASIMGVLWLRIRRR